MSFPIALGLHGIFARVFLVQRSIVDKAVPCSAGKFIGMALAVPVVEPLRRRIQ